MTHAELVETLYHLKSCGIKIPDEAYDFAREADIQLYAYMSNHDAAMHFIKLGLEKKFNLSIRKSYQRSPQKLFD